MGGWGGEEEEETDSHAKKPGMPAEQCRSVRPAPAFTTGAARVVVRPARAAVLGRRHDAVLPAAMYGNPLSGASRLPHSSPRQRTPAPSSACSSLRTIWRTFSICRSGAGLPASLGSPPASPCCAAAAAALARPRNASRRGRRPPARTARPRRRASLQLPRGRRLFAFSPIWLPFGTISATLRSLPPDILTNARFARLNPAIRHEKLIWNAPGTSRALKYTAHLRRACPNRQVQCVGMPARRTRTTTTRSRSRTSGTDRGASRACTL